MKQSQAVATRHDKHGYAFLRTVTADPDRLYARAKAAGAGITSELCETDYGSRDFAARDLEGNRWSFGTYRGEPRKAADPA
ncbi:VOC family protein [Streptomyces sp. NPDC005407]|uniref:VOC family protein n=1 Tax=Streptomyces sp. NPDC005407 TaxID=3155340 RepID=UPI0033ABE753